MLKQENHKKFIKNKKMILKLQSKFTSQKKYLFTKELSDTILCTKDDNILKLRRSK